MLVSFSCPLRWHMQLAYIVQYKPFVSYKLLLNQRSTQQMNFITVLSNHSSDLWTASTCTIYYSKLFPALPPLSFCSDASFPEQNCKLALSHMDTDVAFTKLCILSVAMTSKVLKTDRHRHPLMYKLLYLDMQSTKHVTSINVSYLIYYGHLTDAKNSTEMHRNGWYGVWKMQRTIGRMAHMLVWPHCTFRLNSMLFQAKNVL